MKGVVISESRRLEPRGRQARGQPEGSAEAKKAGASRTCAARQPHRDALCSTTPRLGGSRWTEPVARRLTTLTATGILFTRCAGQSRPMRSPPASPVTRVQTRPPRCACRAVPVGLLCLWVRGWLRWPYGDRRWLSLMKATARRHLGSLSRLHTDAVGAMNLILDFGLRLLDGSLSRC